ncbi:MAG: RNA 2',3'-cyclic phosphodiesterase [Candidatus Latescibacteria bacterium]|jgi:RNA 2',3'-cyclic 3'-phosphodiesterase|nr:RNA 2',3'-cyclic phosphodiesterase [Candidatus Latescibacterota bacterium]MBT4139654.1 RNA 2',3'-cyclic phosphodiesterase [Candidatus Latescibacterota bacterium]
MADTRTFIAFELPPVVKQQVRQVVKQLAFLDDLVRWSKPEGVHLTLQFLGDVSPELMPQIIKMVQKVAKETPPLSLCLSGLGGFASLNQARVIWLGVLGDVLGLCNLQSLLEAELTPFGLAPERRKYFPHITLGRARRNAVAVDVARVGPIPSVLFRADKVTVMKSTLGPDGAAYHPLAYGLLKT